MEQSSPTLAKIPILDTGKFEQWKFRIQQYLQHEHYALWEVIEFGDSYEAPQQESATASAIRTTLLLALPDEHQLRFNKYKTAQELWAAILKTFGGNEATKKTKKNLLKQQYGNFKAEGSETLEQTFNRLQAIVSHLEFMDIEIEQDDLNQKFLTSLAPEWLMHTIVWRNRSDLDTMTKNSSGNEKVNTASIPTASTQVSPAGPNIATTSINLDTACAYIAFQSNGSQIKYEDINQIDEDDIGEMDIKWSAFNCHKMSHFVRECRAPRSQERGWDWSFMANEEENHALVADEEAPTEFALMAKSNSDNEDMSWTGLHKFANDTITDYSRLSPAIESNSDDLQNRNPSVTETGASSSTILSKPAIKFVKAAERPTEIKTNKGNSHNNIDDKGYWDSGCSRHMIGNISYLSDYDPFDGGYVSFGQGGCKITSKGTIKTGKLEFENMEHTQKRDPAVNIDWWLHARMVVLDHFMPFIDQFREGVYNFADILTKENNAFERLFDDLDAEYKKTFAELQTMLAQSAQEKKSSAKESKYEQLYTEQRDEFKKFAANFVELDKLHKSKNQLQEKDNVIKDLQKQISEMQVSRERSTEGRVKTQALETALSQLKAQLASAHIQLNSYKAENKTLSQRYEELAKSNMASRVQLSGRITALTTKNATLKARVTGKQNSRSKSLAKLKVTATWMVSDTTKGIFINQSKYAIESLKKYGFKSCDLVDTLMVEKSKLDEDKEGKAVDPSHYYGMIGTLLYLTASRPDLLLGTLFYFLTIKARSWRSS
nr:ribonuclease H-like domain-containing protein [Tanacetum cinerariifolium]